MKRRRHTRYILIFSVILILATLGLAACLGAGRGENPSNVGETDEITDYDEGYIPEDTGYQELEDVPVIELELQMAQADAALLSTFDSYYGIDFRDVNYAHWGYYADWLTFNNPAAIWANVPLQGFQLIGIYLGHSEYGTLGYATHVYYEVDLLETPFVLNWFFTAGLFPNNGISFVDADGVRRYFAIWAAYGHEDSEPFRLTEFIDGGYIFRLDAYDDPIEGEAVYTSPPIHGTSNLIDGDFEITIPFMAAREVILLGILDFESGVEYDLTMYTAEGHSAFIGVTYTTEVTSASGFWRPSMIGPGRMNMRVTHYGNGFIYLFLVNPAIVPIDQAPEWEIFDVTVSIRVLSDN